MGNVERLIYSRKKFFPYLPPSLRLFHKKFSNLYAATSKIPILEWFLVFTVKEGQGKGPLKVPWLNLGEISSKF